MDLSDDDKTCLVANMVAGYEEGRFGEWAQSLLNQLLGYQVEPVEDCYPELLNLYFKLGGGIGIKNLSGLNFSHNDYMNMAQLNSQAGIETYLQQQFGIGLTVERAAFDTFVIY